MYFIMNNYTEAHNYETLIEPKLTYQEIKKIENSSVHTGVYNFIEDRCIRDVAVENRPFHCVDDSRNKYLLYTGDEWRIDKNANNIIDCATSKIKELYDLEVKRGDSRAVRDSKVDKIGEMLDFEKLGKKKVLRALNKKTLLKNN